MIPAVGQGALAIEARANDLQLLHLVQSLDDESTRACCTAERALLRELGGGCQLPIAAHATSAGRLLALNGLVASSDGKQIIRDHATAPAVHAEKLGAELAGLLLRRGAGSLLSH